MSDNPTALQFSHKQSLLLVLLCTVFGVTAQFLIKTSTTHPMMSASGGLDLLALATNYAMWLGLACYGISTVLLVLALRDGELSLLYPVISLTYVWVILLGAFVFHEAINVYKASGVLLICSGVTLLGLKTKADPQ